jgi:hypothetical protein
MSLLELLKVTFPISGVETYVFVPFLVALVISFFTSMGGVSGAFLILPFQMSILDFTSPSVSSTNFLYNLIGIPGGVYRYIKEERMLWPLTVCIIIGTLPGVFLGYLIRVKYLPDPKDFKFFVGLVLLFIGYRLILSMREDASSKKANLPEEAFRISNVSWSINRIRFRFLDRDVSFNVAAVTGLSLVIGIIGGIYGIGGGAIIAPFLVSILHLPVYVVSGAVLMGTFLTSVSGLVFYSTIPLKGGVTAPADWPLGILFGLGGLCGMYLGARVQRYMPEKVIKLILALVILIVSGRYILQFFGE